MVMIIIILTTTLLSAKHAFGLQRFLIQLKNGTNMIILAIKDLLALVPYVQAKIFL
jgi:hypothetical protein